MAGKSLRFLVVFFSKNRRLFTALAALVLVIVVVGLTVSLRNWRPEDEGEALTWTIVRQDPAWQGVPASTRLPKCFVAGGIAFDKEILVDGWGMQEQDLTAVDYMEELGIHVVLGEVTQILYSANTLQVYIAEKEVGYQLVTVNKGNFSEGDLQIVFINGEGVKIGYEEEFVYSVPLNYSIVDSGPAAKGEVFMEALDAETLPVLTEHGPELLSQRPNSLLLYIQGAEVGTIQRNQDAVRIYVAAAPGFQIVDLPTALLLPGKNTVRLIDSSTLEVIAQLVCQIEE